VVKYWVKWEGYGENQNTLEPEESLPPKAVKDYWRQYAWTGNQQKKVEEGGTSSVLGGYVSSLLQGLIPLSCYIFPCIFFSYFPVCFLVEDFLRSEACKELVF